MTTMTCPATAFTRQLSGKDPQGRFILSVLAKRTYTVRPDGRCVPHDDPEPLREEPECDPEAPALLLHDTDLFAYKPATDVVVKGHAYGYDGRRQFEAAVS